MITTKQGDKGYTDLKERRVSKTDPIIETLGLLDETSALIMLADSYKPIKYVEMIISDLNIIASIYAGYDKDFDFNHISLLEKEIISCDEKFSFQYPFKQKDKLYVNLARTNVRKLELKLWSDSLLDPQIISYVNRLSDYLYINLIM